jgi:hypothetical protein
MPERDPYRGLEAALEFSKLLVTLATGSIVLSATFLEKFYRGHDRWELIASWTSFGVSVFVGLLVFGQYISQLEAENLKVRRGPLEVLSLIQMATLLAGMAFLALFAVTNVT